MDEQRLQGLERWAGSLVETEYGYWDDVVAVCAEVRRLRSQLEALVMHAHDHPDDPIAKVLRTSAWCERHES